MRARRAIIPFLLLAALPSIARANYAFQGIVSLSGGYTSNAAGAAAGTPGADPDALILVSPSIVFTSALARALQRVSYNFTAQFYAQHPELATISNRLDWTGIFIPSSTTDLAISAFVLQSRLNNPVFGDTNGTELTRIGTETYWSTGLTERLAWNLSPQLRLVEGANFSAFLPTSTALGQSYITNANLGLTRSWRYDSFGGDLQLGYYYYRETRGPVNNPDGTVNPDGVVSPTQQDISVTLMLRWRRDIGHFWNVNLGAGVATVFRANDGGGQIWQPVGEAGIHYVHPNIQLDLTYTRALMPNPIVQSTFIGDTVALRGAVPFGKKSRVALSGTGSYVHYQDANTFSGHLTTKVDLFSLDVGLNWSPRDWVVVATHYNYMNQLADSSQSPPIASIERHVFLVSLTITYPPQGAANVTTRQAMRVDRSDVQAFPDLHSPPNK